MWLSSESRFESARDEAALKAIKLAGATPAIPVVVHFKEEKGSISGIAIYIPGGLAEEFYTIWNTLMLCQ